jgi:hypothetical protein
VCSVKEKKIISQKKILNSGQLPSSAFGPPMFERMKSIIAASQIPYFDAKILITHPRHTLAETEHGWRGSVEKEFEMSSGEAIILQ